ncbi:leucine-rich repeat receptor-like protein kinase PXC1 [Typha angustifolia]|uniref:leucine-rich repeat receptor-like protein kinase PXC1 n=1 Tax=Typha angustifolia TaxID=59011 RepID=UPI003C2E8F93
MASFLLLLVLLLLLQQQQQILFQCFASDTDALTIFRQGADAHGNLVANWSSPDACSGRWIGVECSAGRVTSLSLPSLDLRGPLDPLSQLDRLRLLDLHGNRLNGTLLPFLSASLPNLKLLYLSRNDLSGGIPPSIGLLAHLVRADLSENDLRGPIPGDALVNLTRLLTLRLQNNLLSGPLPDLSAPLPRLAEFNVSNNQLSGRVPDGMRNRFGVTSFGGNAGLCGPTPPLPLCSFIPRDASPSASSQSVVPSNPSSISSSSSSSSSSSEAAGANGAGGGGARVNKEGLSTGAITGIATGNVLFLLVLLSLLIVYCCCCTGPSLGEKDDDKRNAAAGMGDSEHEHKAEIGRYSDGGESDGVENKLVFFGINEEDGGSNSGGATRRRKGRTRFELEDLLRASAEMVGKGSLGTVYRALLDDGCMVAVKRLRDANPCTRKEFHKYMDLIGRLRHHNLVRLRAYYYAKQEKLLIYDFLPNGSLHALLHGNRGAGRTPLDWTTRIALVLGGARGLARIHNEYTPSGIPHGNVKSSNVLLDKNGVACVADFGLSLLLSPALAIARLGGYMAPEQAHSKRLSQEADVYGFGVLILEVLTGRAPTQYPPPNPPSHKHSKKKGEEPTNTMIGVNLPEWVRSVVREEWTAEVFDAELLRYKNIEEEMVAMLHVGLACVAQQPEQRPTMTEVVKMIEDIRMEQSPRPEEEEDLDDDESRHSAATTTEDGRLSY